MLDLINNKISITEKQVGHARKYVARHMDTLRKGRYRIVQCQRINKICILLCLLQNMAQKAIGTAYTRRHYHRQRGNDHYEKRDADNPNTRQSSARYIDVRGGLSSPTTSS